MSRPDHEVLADMERDLGWSDEPEKVDPLLYALVWGGTAAWVAALLFFVWTALGGAS